MSDNLNEIKEALSNEGVYPTHKTYRNTIEQARKQAQVEADEEYNNTVNEEWAENVRYWLGVVAQFFVYLFLVLGLVLFLLVLPVTEFLAVYEGFQYFMPNKAVINGFSAFSLSMGMVVLPYLKHMLADNLHEKPLRLALARTLKNVWYWLGFGEEPEKLSRSMSLYVGTVSAMFAVNLTILTFGFIGRVGNGQTPVAGALYTLVIAALIMALDAVLLLVYRIFVMRAGTIDLQDRSEEKLSFFEQRSEYYQEQLLNDLLIAARAKNEKKRQAQLNSDEPTTS